MACVRQGVACSGYQRDLLFKDVSEQAAESSRKFEAARWAALRQEDAKKKKKRDQTERRHSSEGGTETIESPEGAPISALLQAGLPCPSSTSEASSQDAFFFSCSLDISAINGIGEDQEQLSEMVSFGELNEEASVFFDAGLNGTSNFERELIMPAIEYPPNDCVATSDSPAEPRSNHSDGPDMDSPDSDQDQLVESRRSKRQITLANNHHLGDPTTDCQLSSPTENILVRHFDNYVTGLLPVSIKVSDLYGSNQCFQYAVLALAASNMTAFRPEIAQKHTNTQVLDCKSGWNYYSAAVKELNRQLQHPGKGQDQQLAGAAILLAYYEISSGSPYGVRNHVRGLNAIASKLDFADTPMPELYKAWRMLRYDVRFFTVPLRETTSSLDLHDAFSMLDPQLAIRDILSTLWALHTRYAIEASFGSTNDAQGHSASQQASAWIRSTLGRQCDHRNYKLGGFHTQNLTLEEVAEQCGRFSKRLDQWHKTLRFQDHPMMKLDTVDCCVEGPGFETIVPLHFPDSGSALDYMMYLLSRLICHYLRSLYDPTVSATTAETWAKVILGIVCGLDTRRQRFTALSVPAILWTTALLCEGTNIANIILAGVLPRLRQSDLTTTEAIAATYVKDVLEVVLRERLRGRAIRVAIVSIEEEQELWQEAQGYSMLAFGDYNGKGHFRACHSVKGSYLT